MRRVLLESRFHIEFVNLHGAFEMDPGRVQQSREALYAPVGRLVGNVDLRI